MTSLSRSESILRECRLTMLNLLESVQTQSADCAAAAAAVAFADPGRYAGKVVPVARERLSFGEVAETLTEVTGVPVRCASIQRPLAIFGCCVLDARHASLVRDWQL